MSTDLLPGDADEQQPAETCKYQLQYDEQEESIIEMYWKLKLKNTGFYFRKSR